MWSRDGRTLYFATDSGGALRAVDLGDPEAPEPAPPRQLPRELVQSALGLQALSYDSAPGGSLIAVTKVPSDDVQMIVVESWFSGLERSVPVR